LRRKNVNDKNRNDSSTLRSDVPSQQPVNRVQTLLRQPSLPTTCPVTIDSFRFEFGFLSNFYESSIWVGGERYPSVEHAYQAAKAGDESTKRLIREADSPAVAKRLGFSCQLPPDWDTRKVDIMRGLVREKFKNPLLRPLLLATGDAMLIEGNTWNDTTWGICRGKGQNWLGRILMQVRDECRAEEEEITSP
jgi:ribA/ribD-fused uncharacterized protein